MMEMKLVLSESAVSFGFTGDAIVLQKNILGAAIEFKYSSSPSLSVSDCSVLSAPTAQSALAALAVTSRYSPALSLLSPAFSGLSSADLSEFFGSFARVAPERSSLLLQRRRSFRRAYALRRNRKRKNKQYKRKIKTTQRRASFAKN